MGFFSCFSSSDRPPKRKARTSTSTASTDQEISSHEVFVPAPLQPPPQPQPPTKSRADPISLPPGWANHKPAPLHPRASQASRDSHPRHQQAQQAQQPQQRSPNMPPKAGVRKKTAKGTSKAKGVGYFNAGAPSGGGGGGGSSTTSSESKLDKMFDELKEAQDPKDSLGVESTMNYLSTNLNLNPESGEIFVALELVQAPNFGEIQRKGFVDGWRDAGVAATKSAQAQCIRQRVSQLSTDAEYFKKVYRYTFVAGKEADQRAMALDNAIEFWRALFSTPGRPWRTLEHDWLSLWTTFLAEKWTRSVNRDMWNQLLEFATKSMEDQTLGFWNEDGAWPSVIDDFVAWCKGKGIGSTGDVVMD